MAIWNVFDKESSALILLRTSDNNFRVVQYGGFGMLLTGSDYTLVHEKLIPAFKLLLTDQIEIQAVSIVRTSTNESWDHYFELVIKEHINPEHLGRTNSFGEQVWLYNHNLFVSNNLKMRLMELSEGSLQFSDGLSYFAG